MFPQYFFHDMRSVIAWPTKVVRVARISNTLRDISPFTSLSHLIAATVVCGHHPWARAPRCGMSNDDEGIGSAALCEPNQRYACYESSRVFNSVRATHLDPSEMKSPITRSSRMARRELS